MQDLNVILQLCAENNWTVANLSSAANYFHILRRQAKMLGDKSMRPLVIVSPKSLLRHPLVGADVSDLTEGHFQTVLEQPGTGKNTDKVEKILFASGKMAIDLAERVKDGKVSIICILFVWNSFIRSHLIKLAISSLVIRTPKSLFGYKKNRKIWVLGIFANSYIREVAGDKKVPTLDESTVQAHQKATESLIKLNRNVFLMKH